MWTLTLEDGDYHGLPVSGEAVRRFYRDVGHDEHGAILRLMRLAFPLTWRRLWWRDIARRVAGHPDRAMLVQGYLRLADPTPKVPDSWDRLQAAQTVVEDAPKGVPFDVVCGLVELRLGAGWWHDPSRWETADGFAPYDVVMASWRLLQRDRAAQRLDMVRAIVTAKAGDRATGLLESDEREANGG